MADFENKSILVLSFTDQYSWGFSESNGISLNCSTDVDEAWYASMSQVFGNVLRYDIFKGANRAGICAANREIIELASAYHPDYVFYPCNFSGIVTEETLATLRALGAILVVSFFDDDVLFDWCKGMISRVDYIVTHFPQFVDTYRAEGARAFLMHAIPYNPARTRKLESISRRVGATFVGSLYSYRKDYISAINRAGAELTYVGGGIEHKLSYAAMVRVFNESRINVNFSSGVPGRIGLVGRIFEVSLCGGFLLSEYIPGLEQWFKVGEEIDCFTTPEEAADKVNFYLANPEIREAMAARAHQRALSQYSSRKMLTELFDSIEEDVRLNGRPSTIRPSSEGHALRAFEAGEYYKWTKALLDAPSPLREEWIETARLVVDTNPSHRGALRLLKRADRWGDPRPLRKLILSAQTRIRGAQIGLARLKRTRIGRLLAAGRRKFRAGKKPEECR